MSSRRRYPVTLILSLSMGWFISLIFVLQFKIVEVNELGKQGHSQNAKLAFPSRVPSSNESETLPTPFNPFTDIHVSDQPMTKAPPYSSFHCVQADQSGNPDYMARTCEYRNIYYRPSDQSFHYHARPHELDHYNSTTHLEDSMTVADGFLRWDKLNLGGLEQFSTKGEKFTYEWSPKVILDLDEYATLSSPSNPVFVLYLPSYSFNLGHLVFDDMLSIFAMLHMFGYAINNDIHQPIPLFVERANAALGVHFGSRDPFWRCHPQHAERWAKCIKLWTRVYPPLMGVTPDPKTGDILRTGNWLRGSAAIGEYDMAKSSKLDIRKPQDSNSLQNAPFLLLPTVINGPGRLANWSCKGECAIGRGLWLWEFRQYLLNNILGRAIAGREIRQKGYITVSLPVGSTHADKVTFFEDVIAAAKNRFGESRIKVVDMATLSMADQAQLVRASTVYLTNHGGGTASAIFLPRGSTLLLYHGVGRQGEPKMLDRHFWNSMGYIRTLWIHPDEHHNVEKSMDFIQYAIDTASTP